jgi:hypothetical protein
VKEVLVGDWWCSCYGILSICYPLGRSVVWLWCSLCLPFASTSDWQLNAAGYGCVTFPSVHNRSNWCVVCSTGAKFADICKLTDTFEGSISRVLRRLEELLRQLAAASLAIGNAELKAMFEDGAKRIRRGVVFAASLYL